MLIHTELSSGYCVSAGSHPFESWLQNPTGGENQEEEEKGTATVKKSLTVSAGRGVLHNACLQHEKKKKKKRTQRLI